VRGRKPKPTVLKIREGNPGKRALNDREPTPADGVPDRPEMLIGEAAAEWDRVSQVLAEMGLLTRADRSALAAYCTAYARWLQAEEQVAKFGTIVKSPEKGFPMKSPYLTVADQALETMRKFMVEFGLTPSSRSRIRLPGHGPAEDEFDAFVEAAS
jgi:P27 family predicted phage terminase small subunit